MYNRNYYFLCKYKLIKLINSVFGLNNHSTEHIDQAKIELITTFLGRNFRFDFVNGACLQIQKSANKMYVAGEFRRHRGSKKFIEGVKNGNSQFVFITKIAAFPINIKFFFNILYLKVHLYVFDSLETFLIVFDYIIKNMTSSTSISLNQTQCLS